MVKLYEDGIYLRRGSEVVPAAEAAERGITQTPEDAKRGTIAYSILQAHNTSGDPEALKIRFDAMASHDITFVGIIQTARASGMTEFPPALSAVSLSLLSTYEGFEAFIGAFCHPRHFFAVGCRSPPPFVWIRPQHRTKTSKRRNTT